MLRVNLVPGAAILGADSARRRGCLAAAQLSASNPDEDAVRTGNSSSIGRGGLTRVKFVLQRQCLFGEHFKVIGEHPALGGWDPDAAIALEWSDGHCWTAELDVPQGNVYEYKFVLKCRNGWIHWQPGPNRVFATKTKPSLVVSQDWEIDGACATEVEEPRAIENDATTQAEEDSTTQAEKDAATEADTETSVPDVEDSMRGQNDATTQAEDSTTQAEKDATTQADTETSVPDVEDSLPVASVSTAEESLPEPEARFDDPESEDRTLSEDESESEDQAVDEAAYLFVEPEIQEPQEAETTANVSTKETKVIDVKAKVEATSVNLWQKDGAWLARTLSFIKGLLRSR